jgi:hypothetical protein
VDREVNRGMNRGINKGMGTGNNIGREREDIYSCPILVILFFLFF